MIEAENLVKRFGGHVALSGVTLSARKGSVLGVLGPNGAGKTTTVRILSTLVTPDSGRAVVAGHDVMKAPHEVRRRIGLAGQYAALDGELTGRENLALIGVLQDLSWRASRARAAELLERFDLLDVADRPVRTYSGGLRRRVDLAACLVAWPPVVFLDEPTTGLDPTSRMALWRMVRELVAEGITVLLTTQYLEEADQLADRIVVVDHGAVIAEGTSAQLKRMVGGEWLEVAVASPDDLPLALGALAKAKPVDDLRLALELSDGMATVAGAADALRQRGVAVTGFEVRRPSLDDVFVQLTGKAAG
jgi:ABC-2 type transport system ATP-binding protein